MNHYHIEQRKNQNRIECTERHVNFDDTLPKIAVFY